MEPNPLAVRLCLDNIHLLRDTIRDKRLAVKILHAAVWDTRGTAALQTSYWSEEAHVSDAPGGHPVKALTLDDVLKLSTGPTAVKMDIEGAEHRVLKKAKLDNIEAISLEVHGDPSEVLRALRKQGFETQIHIYPIRKELSAAWLRASPKAYTLLVASYRLTASLIAKPTITIIKGHR